MKKVFNSNNLTYAFPDGSGLETKEWRLRRDLLVEKAKMLGVEGKRDWYAEKEEVDKLFRDRDILAS